ncbi:High-affinity branched-chain amino acid transport ATP-binding protein LivF [Rubrobacter xylanophilus DSM 9941]|uniref:ABC transporter ATP-binding protein n=1 Tax=Rubrobacter xylanophilus TaxID=49319 RepID=UPI001C64380F|nr:ABC transporter ATP-binding protein [Rubrobacter xylanophilus]QYJ16584.1 High-affinity branched-chain amino acid transport ATP-binding protein LivF [Rubrobacter xylanophilus DSM 9941]
MLELESVSAGYGNLQVLHGVTLEVKPGELVALIGANGAGKTTTLRAISGFIRPSSGSISFEGEPLAGKRPHDIVRKGLVQVPEGRSLFGGLTVLENLSMGGYTRTAAEREEALREVYELFPVLEERRDQPAATLSGGQQQMVAIGRALMARPRLLMLDEPSLGLDPKTTARVFAAVEKIRESGVAVLIVEQDAVKTLRLADRAYVLESGEISLQGTGGELLEDPKVRSAYLGL